VRGKPCQRDANKPCAAQMAKITRIRFNWAWSAYMVAGKRHLGGQHSR